MRARTLLGRNAVLATLIACGSAHGTDAVPSCKALPEVAKLSEPEFPSSVESRGLPNPVTVLVEFTLHHDGSVSNPIAIEDDAGSYATKFRAQALQAVLSTRFKAGTPECRGRLKVAFKVVLGRTHSKSLERTREG
jgi:outer membrane biosynthesis protein TonB